jgi:hypothetical protein
MSSPRKVSISTASKPVFPSLQLSKKKFQLIDNLFLEIYPHNSLTGAKNNRKYLELTGRFFFGK